MSKRAEEKAVEYQVKTHGPNVMGGASILFEDEYVALNMNYDFKAGYEEAEKDLGWISVKDRLPEEDGRYITCHAICGVSTRVEVSLFMSGRWLASHEELDHWMSIPKLPKEEEK